MDGVHDMLIPERREDAPNGWFANLTSQRILVDANLLHNIIPVLELFYPEQRASPSKKAKF